MSCEPTISAGPAKGVSILGVEDQHEWKEVLRCGAHDFYHLPEYHRLAELAGEGTARLFVYRDGEDVIALPLLMRAVKEVPGLEVAGGEWMDATSVYGYAGPVASQPQPGGALIAGFQQALSEWLREMRTVAVFSRLHPLIEQRNLLAGLGEGVCAGQTVSIDLTMSPEAQVAAYRWGHQRNITAMREMNATCIHDTEFRYLDRFVEMYVDTMRWVGADEGYFFERTYFEELTARFGDHVHLFVCMFEGKVISGELVTTCRDIVQGHLCAVDSNYRKLASNKFVLDEIRSWATARGSRYFHLGGGVGVQRDSLFDFKAGFSNVRHDFSTWRWVLEPEVYATLTAEKARWNAARGSNSASEGFFPSYRTATNSTTVSASAPTDRVRQGCESSDAEFRVFTTADDIAWMDVLACVEQHDFYYLPQYHRLAEQRGEGVARLFTYHEGGHVIALPLLVRAISDAPDGWNDATSVYGYAGPITSATSLPESVIANFRDALRRELERQRIVAVFSRLHPLISQRDFLDGLGEVRACGQTVSIDLTLSPEEQRSQYSGTYRTRLNKLARNGITCALDPAQRHLAEFVDMYHETMRRVNAHGSYFFGADYFAGLSEQLGSTLQLFITRSGEEIIAGGLFTLCNGIVQYHLGATRDAFLKLSPMGLVIDTARLWGNEQGARVLHLGGGVGSNEDSLFAFKAGFSDRRHRFATWRWVIMPEVYRGLCEERLRTNELNGVEATSQDYFPSYRCPVAPVSEPMTDPVSGPSQT